MNSFPSCYLRHMKQIAIFASGTGSNATALCEYFTNHSEYKVGLILCDRAEAGVYKVAEQFKIPSQYLNADLRYGEPLLQLLHQYGIDYILLAGYLKLMPVEVIRAFSQRILNIHPALLPAFGGKGMYGKHVHAAVLKSGQKFSGITIHVADEKYDEGKIIFQAAVNITPGMTEEDLQKAINVLELKNYAVTSEKYFNSLNQKS